MHIFWPSNITYEAHSQENEKEFISIKIFSTALFVAAKILDPNWVPTCWAITEQIMVQEYNGILLSHKKWKNRQFQKKLGRLVWIHAVKCVEEGKQCIQWQWIKMDTETYISGHVSWGNLLPLTTHICYEGFSFSFWYNGNGEKWEEKKMLLNEKYKKIKFL